MFRKSSFFICVSVALLLLSSCAASPLRETEWALRSMDGRDVSRQKATLRFGDGKIHGNAGCNGYGGRVRHSGDRIRFKDIFRSTRACLGSGLMEMESRYVEALSNGEKWTYVREPGRLTLRSERGRVLVFDSVKSRPAGD